MSFPRYPKYKPSGVSWFGDAPEHWPTIRYKNVFKEKQSVSGDSLPSGSISFGRVVFKSDKILHELTKASYQEVLAGEFLINPINLNYDLKSLRTGLSDINTCVSPAYIVLRAKAESDKNYLKYQLHLFDVSHMKTLGAGVRQTITFGDIGTCSTCLPPLTEQTAIAEFLDRETAKIDGLVAEQRRMMELLKEKRQAVISHAVTKGLNPQAPMKPSHIEWLGDVPEHWLVKPLRHLGRCQNGLNIGGEAFGSGFPFVSYGDVYKNSVLPTSVQGLVQSSEMDWESYSVQRGDVFFTRTSETIDEIGMSSTCLETIPKATFAGFLIRFRPFGALDCRFSKHYFSNPQIRTFFAREMVLITRASLSQDLLKRLPVLVPPESEQLEISDYLDKRSAAFDDLTAEAQRAIDLLQERRAALISAAVTGQIDVR